MKTGEIVYAQTHAELLNAVLGTKYERWMKSTRMLSDGKMLWMIELGGFPASSGWINEMVDANRISEKQVGKMAFENHDTYWGARQSGKSWGPETRVVFDVIKYGSSRRYIFRGVFRLNREESSLTENVWDLIRDEYMF